MSTNKTEVVEDPKLKKLVRVYLKMKSKRDEITQAFKEEEKVLDFLDFKFQPKKHPKSAIFGHIQPKKKSFEKKK